MEGYVGSYVLSVMALVTGLLHIHVLIASFTPVGEESDQIINQTCHTDLEV